MCENKGHARFFAYSGNLRIAHFTPMAELQLQLQMYERHTFIIPNASEGACRSALVNLNVCSAVHKVSIRPTLRGIGGFTE